MKKLNKVEIIRRFNVVHNFKYDYSLMEYFNLDTKIKIICPEHGLFEQTPRNHQHQGCKQCYIDRISKSTEKFIEEANKIHNNFYDYSLIDYKNYRYKIKIICPEHGVFEQYPTYHLKGSGCPKHGFDNNRLSTTYTKEKFVELSNIIHNFKYDYSKSDYINCYTKVEIICPTHGSFFQRPMDHINSKSGCPICRDSKGEKKIFKYLKSNKIIFETQKIFMDCKNKLPLPFDFYLPEHNICIEHDGEQHFRSIPYWGGDKKFEEVKQNDQIKNEYCLKNNIKLFRIKYNEDIIQKLRQFL